MASYFPNARNLKGSNADMCSDVAGPSSCGSGDLFEVSDRSNNTQDPVLLLFPPLLALLAAILDLGVTTTPILSSGHVTSLCTGSVAIVGGLTMKITPFHNV